MYGASALKDKLAGFSKADPRAAQALRSGAVGGGGGAAADADADSVDSAGSGSSAVFDLRMSFRVSGDKMASAIAESVAPRFAGGSGSSKDGGGEVERLKAMISSGVGAEGATKGTTFRFECGPSGIEVSVNGRTTGSVPSPALARAFCDVYLDDKCVSPTLKASILENCCAP
jgi:Chalcone isomerase-like